MGPDTIHLRMLKELDNVTVRPLSITYGESWRLRDIPEDWEKANVTPNYKIDSKEELGNYRPISQMSIPGKVKEQIFLPAITCKLKKVRGIR